MANEKKAAKAVEPPKRKKVKKAKPAGKRTRRLRQRPKTGKADKAEKAVQGRQGRQTRQESQRDCACRAGARELVSSETVYQGPLFRVQHDKLIEPGGKPSERDVIRHNGSVVILAIDSSKSKKNPWIVIERQYRHAANQFLWELPAGKLEAGEEALAGAQRELAEETGYSAKKWKPLVEYYASPGFLGESMKVFTWPRGWWPAMRIRRPTRRSTSAW
jgi:ADP-ribose pyrophosphatase